MPVIGLTGGIATGKSTVGRMLEERGAVLLSADGVSREITAPGSPVLSEIVRAFGPEFIQPDGSLDRSRLGGLVFSDPSARRKLEAITHPAILARLRKSIAQERAAAPDRLIVVEAPLLFEAGMEGWFDGVLTVAASPSVQRERLMARSGLSPEEADARIASQMPLPEKVARSQFALMNDGDLAALERSVDSLLPRLTDEGRQTPNTFP